jgi:glycosyltransferase involved in cell wall biosynthesis
MRMLVVTRTIPFPLIDGNKIRSYSILKNLKKLNIKIDLLVITDESPKTHPELKNICSSVKFLPGTKQESISDKIIQRFSKYPVFFKKIKKNNQDKIDEIIQNEKYTATYIIGNSLAGYFYKKQIKKILDCPDNDEEYILNKIRYQKKISQLILLLKMRTFVKEIHKRFDGVTIISNKDLQELKKISPAKYFVVQNDYDETKKITKSQSIIPRIIYIGDLTYDANLDAVSYFVRRIYPKIVKKCGSIMFIVAGKYNEKNIKSMRSKGISFIGKVKDLNTFYHTKDIMVCPIRFGAGIKNKIIDAMFLKIPIVCSSIAISGIPAKNNKHVMVADTPYEFADAISKLATNSRFKSEICRNAYAFAMHNYHDKTKVQIKKMLDNLKILD